jgi:acetoin utilization deacetylase AcuC-like enzyme
MKAFYCDHFTLPLPPGHRFPMAKYGLLRHRVASEGIVAPGNLLEPEAAPWASLALVHEQRYLHAVAAGDLAPDIQRRIGFPWSPALVERARRSVGGTIAAGRCALNEGTAANLAGGTHHAFADRGEGYCVFNDVAVAARLLQREGLVARPLIVDCDVHQGNGTAAIFRDDASVFTFSIHAAKNYPFVKQQSDLDVALPDHTADAPYLHALERGLEVAFDRHRPDCVFYVAGADPFYGDRLGRLALTVGGLAARDALVLDRCRTAGVPVVVTMGGGYAPELETIVRIHANSVHEAAQRCCARTSTERQDGQPASGARGQP